MSDISQKALEVTKKNFKKISKEKDWPYSLNKQVVFLQSDLLVNYPSDTFFDLIVANLPYIPESRLTHLENAVKNYEPMMALDGGANGDYVIKRLLKQAKHYLRSDGIVILEIDEENNVSSWQDECKCDIIKDQFNKQRFVKCLI